MQKFKFYQELSDGYKEELHRIIYNIKLLKFFHHGFIVPHFTITYLLYQLRFCKSFDLKSKFYECVEHGYNPFRVSQTHLERIMVKNLVKIIDSIKHV